MSPGAKKPTARVLVVDDEASGLRTRGRRMASELELDFRLLFQSAPGCCLVLTPDLTIVAVSDAYLRATMTARDAILGRALFDVFPDNPDEPSATGVANMRASLTHVLTEKHPHEMAVQKYDIRRPASQGGGFEERHWSPVNYPALSSDGRVAYIIHCVEDVTDMVRLTRKESEHNTALRELTVRSEERYRELLDTAPDAMVVLTNDGRIQLVNAQTEKVFGYARSELVGQDLEILVPIRFRQGHAAKFRAFFASPAARPMGPRLELFGRRKDGTEFPIEVSLSPLRGEQGVTVSATIRDVTERKGLEAAAKRTAERLASAVESIQDAFALFDEDDRLVLCNSVYRRLIGESLPGPVVGKSYEELLDAWIRDIDFPDEAVRTRFREERVARRSHHQGAMFEVHMLDGRSLRVIDRRTAEGGTVKTVWDLTDDVERAEELREARAAAEAASAAKSDFLSSMSHELRTPLNAILGFAQLLQRDKKEPLSERHKDRVAQILLGGQHLLRLIDDILDLSRIEAGGLSISTEPVGVLEILDEVKRTLEPMAEGQGIHVKIDALPPELPMVAVDRTRFAQILMNFGSNAIKYNRPAGSVTITVSISRPDRVRIAVKDTGLGIAADKQERLFQPFQRAGQEFGPIQGTGIGLVITKRLAELMGGDVGFRSASGEGSEFWVDTPVHASGARSTPPPARPEGSTPRIVAEGRRLVLYVEDNPASVTFMIDLVSTLENIDLLTATTAELGVDLARRRRPDVVIMDINLPGMSGMEGAPRFARCARDDGYPGDCAHGGCFGS